MRGHWTWCGSVLLYSSWTSYSLKRSFSDGNQWHPRVTCPSPSHSGFDMRAVCAVAVGIYNSTTKYMRHWVKGVVKVHRKATQCILYRLKICRLTDLNLRNTKCVIIHLRDVVLCVMKAKSFVLHIQVIRAFKMSAELKNSVSSKGSHGKRLKMLNHPMSHWFSAKTGLSGATTRSMDVFRITCDFLNMSLN